MPKTNMLFSQKDDKNSKNIFTETFSSPINPFSPSNNTNSVFKTDLIPGQKIFYFVCKQCGKPAKILINNTTLKMDLICENGENNGHDLKNIPFNEIFDNLKTEDKNISKCQKCSLIIENIDSYECKTCSKIYCPKCFIEDVNLNSHKDFEFKNKKCPEHNINYTEYCKDCNENICLYCIKNSEKHKNHKYENYIEIMPSNSDISEMNKNIEEREKFNNDLIEKIIQRCQKCSLIIENIDSFKCKTCSKIYCSNCFIEDFNLNSHKDFEFKNKKCPEHYINYNFCIYCIINNGKV